MAAQDGCPRWLSEMAVPDGCPRWVSKILARDGCQRCLPEMAARDDVPEKHARDSCPRLLSEMLVRDTCPRWLSEKHAREACPRRLPDMAARDGCPRCLGHIFEQFRAHRTLMNMDPKTEAKSGHKTAQKRWAPTVGAHTFVHNLGPFSGLIIRPQQRDPILSLFLNSLSGPNNRDCVSALK